MASKNKQIFHRGYEIRCTRKGLDQGQGIIREKVYISFGDASLPTLDRMAEALVDYLASTHNLEDIDIEPCGHGLARIYVIVRV